jgi:hypothetical protein
MPSVRTETKEANYMIYTMVDINHTARAGKLYMGESETIWNKVLKVVLLAILVTVHIETCSLSD